METNKEEGWKRGRRGRPRPGEECTGERRAENTRRRKLGRGQRERDGFAALRTNFRGPRGKNPLLEGILGSKRRAGVSFWSHYYLFWVKIEGIRHFRPENVLQRKRERPGRIMRSKVEIFTRNG